MFGTNSPADDPSSGPIVLWAFGTAVSLGALFAYAGERKFRSISLVAATILFLLAESLHLFLVATQAKYRSLFSVFKVPVVTLTTLLLTGMHHRVVWIIRHERFVCNWLQCALVVNILIACYAGLLGSAPLNSLLGCVQAFTAWRQGPFARNARGVPSANLSGYFVAAHIVWDFLFVVASYNQGHAPDAFVHLVAPAIACIISHSMHVDDAPWDPYWLYRSQCLQFVLILRFADDALGTSFVWLSPPSWHSPQVVSYLTVASVVATGILLMSTTTPQKSCDRSPPKHSTAH